MGASTPTSLVTLALFGQIPLTLILFLIMRPSRAFIAAYMAGSLLLPQYEIKVPGFIEISKLSVMAIGVAVPTLLLHTQRIRAFRPSIADVPMLLWCIAPVFSSLSNGLGLYDGFSGLAFQLLAWGLPYFFARIYLTSFEHMKEVCVGLLIAGLVYLPLCLIEIRLSPQLHRWVYGFHQHSFSQTKRFGGFRPTVFMQHGIAVALFMALATLVSYYGWKTRGWLRTSPRLMFAIFLAMAATTIMCKSVGAVIILVFGVVILWVCANLRSGFAISALALGIVVYVGLRASAGFNGEGAVEFVRSFNAERAQSLEYRLSVEDGIVDRAQERPLFGWAGWDRGGEFADRRDRSIDSAWILVLGENGWFGLVSFFGVMLGPSLFWLRKWPPRTWRHGELAPGTLGATLLVLFALDKTVNYMPNPATLLFAGCLVSVPSARRLLEVERRLRRSASEAPVQ